MANAKKPSTRTRSPSSSATASTQPTLSALQRKLGSPPAGLSAHLLAAVTEDKLVELGSSYATDDILFSVPAFVADLLEQDSVLSAARVRGYARVLLAAIVSETASLQEANERYETRASEVGSEAASLRTVAKRAREQALQLRDRAAAALLNTILPADSAERAALPRIVGTAESTEKLLTGVRAVGDALERALASCSEERREALALLGYDASFVAEVRAAHAQLRAAGTDAPDLQSTIALAQRELDLQDGKVLWLVQGLFRAVRDARTRGVGVTLPRLGRIERLVSRSAGAEAEEKPAVPTPGGAPAAG